MAEVIAPDMPLVEAVALKYLKPFSTWIRCELRRALLSVFISDTRWTRRKAIRSRNVCGYPEYDQAVTAQYRVDGQREYEVGRGEDCRD